MVDITTVPDQHGSATDRVLQGSHGHRNALTEKRHQRVVGWGSDCCTQNCCTRRRRFSIGGVHSCSGGLYIVKFDKNPMIYSTYIPFGGAWSFVWGFKRPKVPARRRDCLYRRVLENRNT